MTIPVTLTDRFVAAWRAFRQNRKADPEALKKFVVDRANRLDVAVGMLSPSGKAFVRGAEDGGGTGPRLPNLDEFLVELETLPKPQQVALMRHVCQNDPRLACRRPIQAWAKANASLMSAAAYNGGIDALEKGEITLPAE